MIKLIRGWRVLRVGRGRIVRVVLVVVLLVVAWQTLLSRNGLKASTRSHQDVGGASRSPNLQVAAPIKEPQSSAIPANHQVDAPAQPRGPDANQVKKLWKDREAVLRGSDNINPRFNARGVKDKLHDQLHELQPKPVRNQHFLQQNQLNLIDDFQEEDEDEDDYNEDEDENKAADEGKWNGRNKADNAEDNAIEEDDDNAENGNDDFGLEDVGGEKLKKSSDDDEDKKAKLYKKHKKNKRQVVENGDRLLEVGELVGERKRGQVGDHPMKLNNRNDMNDLTGGEARLDMKAIEKELALRQARVHKVCAKYGLGPHASVGEKPAIKHPPTPNYDVFYVDRHEELAWCPIYKAASTSWLYNFLILGGVEEVYIKNTKEQISHMARRVWPNLDYQVVEQAFKTCLKFMIVRHPFERLVSAYRDKLENTNIGKEHGVDHFYKKYGRKIVAKFRPPGQGLPALRYSQDMDDPSIPAPKGVEPTFGEFVKYIIKTDLVYYADDHWMPYYLHCTPCLVNYDVIAKFETLDRDQNYIIKKKHLGDKIKPSWKHMTKGVKTADTIRKYFATITKKDLMDLYNKYKVDFELFDYSVDDYLSYVRES